MKGLIFLAIVMSAVVGVAWAGAWKLGEGGGWLIFLAFVMFLSTSFSYGDKDG